MASSIMHLSIAEFLNTHYFHFKENDRERFLLGSIIVDCYQIAEKPVQGKPSIGKKISHFIKPGYNADPKAPLDFTQYIPDIEQFSSKYFTKLKDTFYLGYLAHLLADVKWWGEVIPNVVKENIVEINPNARKIEEITNEEYLKWYRDSGIIYKEFDDTDISLPILELGLRDRVSNRFPKFENININEFDISELGDTEIRERALEILKHKFEKLEDTIDSNEEKCFNISLHDKIGYKRILDYIESSADTLIKYIKNNNLNMGINMGTDDRDER